MYYEQEDFKWFESRAGRADIINFMFEQVRELDDDVTLCMSETKLLALTGANTGVRYLNSQYCLSTFSNENASLFL